MKILIAIPALDMVHTDFALSLAALLGQRAYDKKLRKDVEVAVSCAKGTIIPHSRNLLAAHALNANCSHIFYLDSDMCFPLDTLSRLIAHHKPIVGCDYVRRIEPHQLNGHPREDYAAHAKSGLAPMLTLPFGCILISMKVFAAMERPWFTYREGSTEADTLSEDIYFCNEARKAGHTIWCDLNLSKEIGHIGTKIYRPSDRMTL